MARASLAHLLGLPAFPDSSSSTGTHPPRRCYADATCILLSLTSERATETTRPSFGNASTHGASDFSL